MNDRLRLPLRLSQLHNFDDMRTCINLLREMIVYRGYNDKLEVSNRDYEVYTNEHRELTYLVPISSSGKDTVSKELFVSKLSSIIDLTIDNARVIFVSYSKGSDHVCKLIDIINQFRSNEDYYCSLLLIELADTASSKGTYRYVREWILSKEPAVEWYVVGDIPIKYRSLMPRHRLHNRYSGDTQEILHTELLCRYNLFKIGDIIKVYRKDEPSVHKRVI